MKLSKSTLNILRNLAGINSNLLIKQGNKLMTKAANGTSFAAVTVEETFPHDFAIYDLNELLGVVSIFNDPELEFNEKVLTISEGNNRIRYMPSDVEVLIVPKKEPAFSDAVATFKITAQQLAQISKAASVLKVPFVTIRGDGSKIVVLVHDKSTPNSNQFLIDVDAETEATFDMHIKVESLKMLPDTYEVFVSEKKICKFEADRKVYFVSGEIDSEFN